MNITRKNLETLYGCVKDGIIQQKIMHSHFQLYR